MIRTTHNILVRLVLTTVYSLEECGNVPFRMFRRRALSTALKRSARNANSFESTHSDDYLLSVKQFVLELQGTYIVTVYVKFRIILQSCESHMINVRMCYIDNSGSES